MEDADSRSNAIAHGAGGAQTLRIPRLCRAESRGLWVNLALRWRRRSGLPGIRQTVRHAVPHVCIRSCHNGCCPSARLVAAARSRDAHAGVPDPSRAGPDGGGEGPDTVLLVETMYRHSLLPACRRRAGPCPAVVSCSLRLARHDRACHTASRRCAFCSVRVVPAGGSSTDAPGTKVPCPGPHPATWCMVRALRPNSLLPHAQAKPL